MMSFEQRINLKFLFRLKKIQLKHSSVFKKYMEMPQCQEIGFWSAEKGLRWKRGCGR